MSGGGAALELTESHRVMKREARNLLNEDERMNVGRQNCFLQVAILQRKIKKHFHKKKSRRNAGRNPLLSSCPDCHSAAKQTNLYVTEETKTKLAHLSNLDFSRADACVVMKPCGQNEGFLFFSLLF